MNSPRKNLQAGVEVCSTNNNESGRRNEVEVRVGRDRVLVAVVEVVGLGSGSELSTSMLLRRVKHLLEKVWTHVVIVTVAEVEITAAIK